MYTNSDRLPAMVDIEVMFSFDLRDLNFFKPLTVFSLRFCVYTRQFIAASTASGACECVFQLSTSVHVEMNDCKSIPLNALRF